MAIDREAISETVRPDFAPLTGFVPQVVPGALANGCGGNCEFNPEEARRLLEQAGGWEGELVLWFNSGADHDVWIEAVSNQLRDNLGIENIRFEQLQFAEYLPLLESKGINGPYRLGWIPDYPSPHTYLDSLYATEASSNYTGYSNPEFDQLISEGESAESPEDSVQYFQDAEEILNEDMPAIPAFVAEQVGAYSERVEGVEIGFFDDVNVAEVQVTE
jgi:ABC-type transport system substrate-binding protein